MKKKILFTSIGSLVGQNILDSLQNRNENLFIIGTNSIANAINNFRCNKVHLVSESRNTEKYIQEHKQIILDEKPDLIIPTRDADIVLLSELRNHLPQFYDNFLVGSEMFSKVLEDKVLSYQFSEKYGLPFAPSVQCGRDDSVEMAEKLFSQFDFPFIAKPLKGFGSNGVWIVTNEIQFNLVIDEPGYALQPFFGSVKEFDFNPKFGIPFFFEIPESKLLGCQVIISKSGEIKSMFCFKSKMIMGRCEGLEAYKNSELKLIAEKFAEAAIKEGWKGPFNLQFKLDPKHGFQGIELNGRFSGGTSARLLLGYDELGLVLNDWLGEGAVPEKEIRNTDKTITRILVDSELFEAEIESLNKEKVWLV